MKTWDCMIAFHGEKSDDGGLLHSMQSSIDSWKRDYFPFDIINKFIRDDNSKTNWKKELYKKIDVLAADKSDNNSLKYYNLVNDVGTIVFDEIDGRLSVYITLQNGNGKKLQVYTPCANGEKRPMSLANMCKSETSITPSTYLLFGYKPQYK